MKRSKYLSDGRLAGVVDMGVDCYTRGTGLESRARHGCKIVRPLLAGNFDRLLGASVIKWLPLLALVIGQYL